MRGGTVEKISIAGNKKIEADAIRAKLITREGEIYSDDQIRQDIQELFNTGFFYNVTVDRTDGPGITVTYTVQEKPSITEIDFEGNDELEDQELKEAAGIKPYEILNQSKIREATEKLEKALRRQRLFSRPCESQSYPDRRG